MTENNQFYVLLKLVNDEQPAYWIIASNIVQLVHERKHIRTLPFFAL